MIHGDLGSITDLFIRECVIFRSLFFSLHMIILNFFENSNNCQENCWVFFGFFMKPYSSLKFLKYPRIGSFLILFFFFFSNKGNKLFFDYEFFKYPELGGYCKNQRPTYTGLQPHWAIIKQE